jgi:hypothetical protein
MTANRGQFIDLEAEHERLDAEHERLDAEEEGGDEDWRVEAAR